MRVRISSILLFSSFTSSRLQGFPKTSKYILIFGSVPEGLAVTRIFCVSSRFSKKLCETKARVVAIGTSNRIEKSRNRSTKMEAVALGKPTIFGPFTFNFKQTVDALLLAQGALQVQNEAELYKGLHRLLTDSEFAVQLAARGRQVILDNQGATQRCVQEIQNLLSVLQIFLHLLAVPLYLYQNPNPSTNVNTNPVRLQADSSQYQANAGFVSVGQPINQNYQPLNYQFNTPYSSITNYFPNNQTSLNNYSLANNLLSSQFPLTSLFSPQNLFSIPQYSLTNGSYNTSSSIGYSGGYQVESTFATSVLPYRFQTLSGSTINPFIPSSLTNTILLQKFYPYWIL